jgi:hypothetical protein
VGKGLSEIFSESHSQKLLYMSIGSMEASDSEANKPTRVSIVQVDIEARDLTC